MSKGLKKLTRKERIIYISVASVFFMLLSLLFTYCKPVNTIDYIVSDFFYQPIVEKRERELNIKIIAIDSKTTSELGAFKDWQRSEVAKLIHYLNSNGGGPDVIAFGLDFHEEKDSEGDNELIEACSEYGNICISSIIEKEVKKASLSKVAEVSLMSAEMDNSQKTGLKAARINYKPPRNKIGKENITGINKQEIRL